MPSEFVVMRRVLALSYRRYLEADRDWAEAARAARAWFPAGEVPLRRAIGHPGSPLRRLYERRERALQRLRIVRQALDRARHPARPAQVTVRLLGFVSHA